MVTKFIATKKLSTRKKITKNKQNKATKAKIKKFAVAVTLFRDNCLRLKCYLNVIYI